MEDTMSRNGKSKKRNLKLKLKLSPPPRENPLVAVPPAGSPNHSSSSSSASPPSSCMMPAAFDMQDLKFSSSPEATTMVLVGCPRCLLYVMLSEEDPRCPNCKSTVLLDFLNKNSNMNKIKTSGNC